MGDIYEAPEAMKAIETLHKMGHSADAVAQTMRWLEVYDKFDGKEHPHD